MNHKYSSYILLGLIALMLLSIVYSLDSSGLDEVCGTDERILYRTRGLWQCASLAPAYNDSALLFNVTNTSLRITALEDELCLMGRLAFCDI